MYVVLTINYNICHRRVFLDIIRIEVLAFKNLEKIMPQEIKTITLPLPFKSGKVNCYLIKTSGGFVLIDTGCSNMRDYLEKELEKAGCRPGSLKAVILTHGDFDHTGNAAYLRQKYGAGIAMHYYDAGMVERGNLFYNRKNGNAVIGRIASLFFGFGKSSRFKADQYFENASDLSAFGLDASVVHIPGHSKGSIGILTGDGSLICGDLLVNEEKPRLNTIIDDPAAAQASLEALRGMGIKKVYPGHGKPFLLEELKTKDG